MKNNYEKKERFSIYINLPFICISLIIIAFIAFLTIVIQKVFNTQQQLFHLYILPLFFGLIFEYYRIIQKWNVVLGTALASFMLSFTAFFPFKNQSQYLIEPHIEVWPFYFLGSFLLIAVCIGEVKKPLTEGITLIQSLAIIYWIFDFGLVQNNSIFSKILIGLGLIFCLLSFLNAFTYLILSDFNRLLLSAWSSIIMFIFSVDNIIRVYKNESIENISVLSQQAYVIIQYFVLGISSIHIVTNFIGLVAFIPLPLKERFFNSQYFYDLKTLHIERYSEKQVSILESSICLILLSCIFYINYQFQFLPRNFITWISFIIIPMILSIFRNIRKQNRKR